MRSATLTTGGLRRSAARVSVLCTGIAVAACLTPVSGVGASTMSHDLAKLRSCESSGNYSADTGNGYYGAYQFATSTWHDLGYRGRPDEAKPDTQNDAAMKLHSQDGWRPWPSCAKSEHLS